jgi:pSer/pThr/pTyr-binding forkhead associated (FHA) protein
MVGAVKSSAPKAPTAATGGRLVCLTDGREYTISSAPLVIGREAGCDIVVPNKDVSRRHAEIFVSPQGYVLVDSSTNGTFVNGDRIEAQRVLSRADVIKIGDHEFRFYADKAVEMVSQALSTSTPGMPIVPPPPSGAAERLSPTMHGAPAASAPGAKPSSWSAGAAAQMATFLVRSGLLKGQRLTVRVPVVNIGRGDYNDLVIPDDSVSGSHAKLQRREGVWILVDNESTNGTWVDGERIQGEVALGPGTVIRFGEISVLFEPTDDHLGTEGGSGTKVMGAVRPQIPVPAEPAAPVPAHAEPRRERAAEASPVIAPPRRPPVVMTSPPSRRLPGWVIPTALIVLLGVVAAILLLR